MTHSLKCKYPQLIFPETSPKTWPFRMWNGCTSPLEAVASSGNKLRGELKQCESCCFTMGLPGDVQPMTQRVGQIS